jgi:hypothetical protein
MAQVAYMYRPIFILAVVITLCGTSSADESRTWSDASGQFSVEAALVKYEKGNVTLRKDDKTELVVPLRKLSKTDQEYVRKAIAKEKAEFSKSRQSGAEQHLARKGFFPEERALEMGDKGKLRAVRIIQVIDDENVLVERVWIIHGRRAVSLSGGDQVIEPTIKEVPELLWVEVPTKGMVDGKYGAILSDIPLEVIGTKRYDTSQGGTKTVLHLRPRAKDE